MLPDAIAEVLVSEAAEMTSVGERKHAHDDESDEIPERAVRPLLRRGGERVLARVRLLRRCRQESCERARAAGRWQPPAFLLEGSRV